MTNVLITGAAGNLGSLLSRHISESEKATYRGRYWLDARGNLGVEGGPALVNIVAAIQADQRRQAGGSTTHGYGATGGARGTLAGDGQGGASVFRPYRNREIRILVPGNVNQFFDEEIKNEFWGLFCES